MQGFISDQRGVRELLLHLLENFKFQLSCLSKITGVDLDLLKKFLDGQTHFTELSIEQMSKFTNTIHMLSDGILTIDNNDRIKGIIDHLTYDLEISLETIAIYSEISTEDLESFIKDANSISYEKRYKLATKSLFLHFLFKEISQVK